LLTQAYSPMTIRFFILQAHYRSTVDFSNEALQASEKGLQRLLEAYHRLQTLKPGSHTTVTGIQQLREHCEEAMCDDLNSPMVIAHLFEAAKAINQVHDGKGSVSATDVQEMKDVFRLFMEDILGLKDESVGNNSSNEAYKKAVDLLLELRLKAKQNKDWATSDQIRNELTALGFSIKDTKDGFEWSL
ncbi:MAG: cysteine--tRNA ligase, partial [Fibrobacter sp.]|nr:cysteine--tRNA ligase [Fibrobacter sp.]